MSQRYLAYFLQILDKTVLIVGNFVVANFHKYTKSIKNILKLGLQKLIADSPKNSV